MACPVSEASSASQSVRSFSVVSWATLTTERASAMQLVKWGGSGTTGVPPRSAALE